MGEKIHVINDGEENELMHPLEVPSGAMPFHTVSIVLLIVIVIGAASGFVLALLRKQSFLPIGKHTQKLPQVKKTVGVADKKIFKDSAEGIVKEGGMDGEGQFHLERAGGESQNVYLTSTTVDLNEFVGKKVRVRGETFSSKKAGWLMDVGFVEVL